VPGVRDERLVRVLGGQVRAVPVGLMIFVFRRMGMWRRIERADGVAERRRGEGSPSLSFRRNNNTSHQLGDGGTTTHGGWLILLLLLLLLSGCCCVVSSLLRGLFV
jgi:hypothetical protein